MQSLCFIIFSSPTSTARAPLVRYESCYVSCSDNTLSNNAFISSPHATATCRCMQKIEPPRDLAITVVRK